METKTEETKEEETSTGSISTGDESPISELDRADSIAERQKRENDRREALLEREEKLEARRAIGGRTDAGVQQEKPKEIDDVEYAKRAQAGEYNVQKE